ncbi:MAG TPA: DMT family transporter [Pyrinomonadaceae bacterium]|nr:DMT family transporter [Pyrinomonadaceae bacterium]
MRGPRACYNFGVRSSGATGRHTTEAEGSSAYLYMLASSLAFATMGALSHLAGERCDWQLVAVARTLVAFVLAAALAVSTGVRLVFFRPRVLWVRSIAGSASLLCAFYALTHLPVSTTVTLTNTVPVWVTLLAWPVLGHKPARAVWTAILIGLVGVALIQRPEAASDRAGVWLALLSAVGTAVGMIGLNRLGGLDVRAVVTHFSGVSAAFALASLLVAGRAVDYSALGDARTLLLLAGVGLTGTLGQFALTRAYATGNPSRVSVVGLSQVVFALAFDLVLWRRRFDLPTLAGILLVTVPSAWLILSNPLRRPAAIHTTSA